MTYLCFTFVRVLPVALGGSEVGQKVVQKPVRRAGGGLLRGAQAQDRRLRNMDNSVEYTRLFLKPEIHLGPGGMPGDTCII